MHDYFRPVLFFRLRLLLSGILMLFVWQGFSQEKNVKHQVHEWMQYYAQFKVSEQERLLVDVGYRWRNIYSEGTVYFVRLGYSRSISDKITLGGGISHAGYFYDRKELSQIEYRPYQELSVQHKLTKFSINQRLRIEERFFKPNSSDHRDPYNWFNWRFRVRVMLDVPLFALSEQNPDYRFSVGIGDELFINAGKNIIYNHFDQNRFTVSPTFHLGKNLNISTTWTNQYAATFTENQFSHTQVFWLQIRQKFDLSKQTKSL